MMYGGIGPSRRSEEAYQKNPWILHVKKYQAAHPGMKYWTAIKQAKDSYVKLPPKPKQPFPYDKDIRPKYTKEEREYWKEQSRNKYWNKKQGNPVEYNDHQGAPTAGWQDRMGYDPRPPRETKPKAPPGPQAPPRQAPPPPGPQFTAPPPKQREAPKPQGQPRQQQQESEQQRQERAARERAHEELLEKLQKQKNAKKKFVEVDDLDDNFNPIDLDFRSIDKPESFRDPQFQQQERQQRGKPLTPEEWEALRKQNAHAERIRSDEEIDAENWKILQELRKGINPDQPRQNFRRAAADVLEKARQQQQKRQQSRSTAHFLKNPDAGIPGIPPDMDLYTFLGITPDANEEQMKKGLAKIMRTYHPDKVQYMTDGTTPEQAKELYMAGLAAYDILANTKMRAAYQFYNKWLLQDRFPKVQIRTDPTSRTKFQGTFQDPFEGVDK